MKYTILLVVFSCQLASCDQLWWPFTWLKIGMRPNVVPVVRKHSLPPSYANGRPRNMERFLQQQNQIRSAVGSVKSAAANLHWWGAIGDSVKIDQNERFLKNIESENSTTSSTAPLTTPSTTAGNCSLAVSPPELRASTVAKTCAPGHNCRIHLRSFETGDPLFQYAYSHSTALDPILQNIYDTTRGSAFAPPLTSDSMVAPEVVKLCMALVKALRANRVLVGGVFTGLSVVGAALAVEYGGQIVGVEDPRYIKYWNSIGGKFAFEEGLAKNIVIQANGRVDEYLDLLAKTQPNTFDFVLLDDNDVENYGTDYEHALKLLRPRGIMVINDVFVEGSVLSGLRYRNKATDTVSNLTRKILDDNRLESAVTLPFGGGIIMLVKK